jgi:acetate kinase
MGTRSGDVDPSLHQYLGSRLNMTQQEISDLLNKQSGLLGLSGQTNDMRELLQLEAKGDTLATLAVEVFCYRLAKAIAALMVALGRLDAVVFTGGIGENSAPVREKTLALLPFLGLEIDVAANVTHGADQHGRITTGTSPCAMVVRTDEELVIARDTATLIA